MTIHDTFQASKDYVYKLIPGGLEDTTTELAGKNGFAKVPIRIWFNPASTYGKDRWTPYRPILLIGCNRIPQGATVQCEPCGLPPTETRFQAPSIVFGMSQHAQTRSHWSGWAHGRQFRWLRILSGPYMSCLVIACDSPWQPVDSRDPCPVLSDFFRCQLILLWLVLPTSSGWWFQPLNIWVHQPSIPNDWGTKMFETNSQ